MDGILLFQYIGAIVRWLFTGCKRKLKDVQKEDNEKLFTKNLFIGFITFCSILFLITKFF